MLARYGLLFGVVWFELLSGQSSLCEPLAKPNTRGCKAYQPSCTDRYGDPLPSGAVARLGTVRFRHPFAGRLAYSPDGKLLASGGGDFLIRLWDPATGKECGHFQGHQDSVYGIAFSPDGSFLASGSFDKTIRIWDVASHKELRVLRGHKSAVLSVAFSSDGKWLASGGDSTVRIWEVSSGRELHRFDPTRGVHPTGAAVFSPDGKLLAAAWTDHSIHLWRTADWKELKQLKPQLDGFIELVFTPNSKRIVTCGSDGTVRLWDVASGKERRRLSNEREVLRWLAMPSDGKFLAVSDVKGKLAVWDIGSGRELARWKAERECLSGLAFSPDGKTLATVALTSDIRLWDAATGKRLNPTSEPIGSVKYLAFSPDGRLLAVARSCANDEGLHLWDARTWKEQTTINDPQANLSGIAFSPDGKMVASAHSLPGIIRLWDANTGASRGCFRDLGLRINGFAYSPIGDCIILSDEKGLSFRDPSSGMERRRVKVEPNSVLQIAYSSDGRLLASAGSAELPRLWDTTGKMNREFGHLPGIGLCVSLSPDGRTLFAPGGEPTSGYFSGKDGCLWETATGGERCRLQGHLVGVSAGTFSPDGQLLATANLVDGIIHIWDAFTGKKLRRLIGHRGRVNVLAFSPGGKLLASGSADSTVLIWDVSELPFCRRRTTDLSAEQLQDAWGSLAAENSAKAYQAIATLTDHPMQAGIFLGDALRQKPDVEEKRVRQLLADLDANEFTVREKASEELRAMGRVAMPALKESLRNKPSLETARRVRQLLEKLEGKGIPPNRLRGLRTIEILERIGTPLAQEALQTLAERSPDPSLVQDAKASLRRLAKQRGF